MNNAELEKFEKLLLKNKELLEQQHSNLIELTKSFEQLLSNEVAHQGDAASSAASSNKRVHHHDHDRHGRTEQTKDQAESSTSFFSQKSDKYFFDSFVDGKITLIELLKETLKDKNEDQKIDLLVQLYNNEWSCCRLNPIQTLLILFDAEKAVEALEREVHFQNYFTDLIKSEFYKDRNNRIGKFTTFFSKIPAEQQELFVAGLLDFCGNDYRQRDPSVTGLSNDSTNEVLKEVVSFLPSVAAKCVVFRGIRKAFASIRSNSGSGNTKQLCAEQVPDSVNNELEQFFTWFLDASRGLSSEEDYSYIINYTRLFCGTGSFLESVVDCFPEVLQNVRKDHITAGGFPAEEFRIYSENYDMIINLDSYLTNKNFYFDDSARDMIRGAQSTVVETLLENSSYNFLESFALTKDSIKNYVASTVDESEYVENTSKDFLESFVRTYCRENMPDARRALVQANCVLSEFEQLTSMEKHQLFGVIEHASEEAQQACFKALQTLAEVDSNVDFDKLHDVCVKISEKKKLQK